MHRHGLAWACGLALATPVLAQTDPQTAPSTEEPAPQAAPQRVEITGGKLRDDEQRRNASASKIVIGRGEIEQYGDATLGELMKRLPGVSTDGRSGRGGNIRMRGLGGGYTQILLDGQRVQGGLSLDGISPDQIERIEILRAPTAETGARAIAGTVNIVLREGVVRRVNDVRANLALEGGQWSPSLSWTRSDDVGDWTAQWSLNANSRASVDDGVTTTRDSGYESVEASHGQGRRNGIHLSTRLRWKGEAGDEWLLTPMLMASRGSSRTDTVRSGTDPQPYAGSHTDADSSFSLARLNAQWRTTTENGGRLEARAGVGQGLMDGQSQRIEDGVRRIDSTSASRDRNATLNLKYSLLLDERHSLAAGLEAETAQRTSTCQRLEDGVPTAGACGDAFTAATRRAALYAQDEFTLTPQWSGYLGARWEGIATEGGGVRSTSSVFSPMAHLLWRPEPNSRNQVRASLTRSYRAPDMGQLLGRPAISVANSPTSPDSVGNPALKPELATGLDVAFEHYGEQGGLVSVSYFYRRIQNLMRSVTALQTVPWASEPRWVSMPINQANAITQGLELEAKGRLNQWLDDAPAVDLRANASFYRSSVASVPGPDNRLNQQPAMLLNLGGDWRVPTTPLTVGASINLTPGYTTRVADNQWVSQSRKRGLDAYAQWQFSPHLRLRLTASNLAPEDALTTTTVASETATGAMQTTLAWRLAVEAKL